MWVGYQPSRTPPNVEGQWTALRLTPSRIRWLLWQRELGTKGER
jgi:hypothetical protein